LNPSAGEPVAHVSYSQGWVRVVGVLVDEPVPDSFSAGADRITWQFKIILMCKNRKMTQLWAYIKASFSEGIPLCSNLGDRPAIYLKV